MDIEFHIQGQRGLCQQVALEERQEAVQPLLGKTFVEELTTCFQQTADEAYPEVAEGGIQLFCLLWCFMPKGQQQVQCVKHHPAAVRPTSIAGATE